MEEILFNYNGTNSTIICDSTNFTFTGFIDETDGLLKSNNVNHIATDFIAINNNTDYQLQLTTKNCRFALYNNEKEYLSGFYAVAEGLNDNDIYEFNSNNASFIRISVYINNESGVKLQKIYKKLSDYYFEDYYDKSYIDNTFYNKQYIDELQTQIPSSSNDLFEYINLEEIPTYIGYLNNGEFVATNTTFRTTDFIEMDVGVNYIFKIEYEYNNGTIIKFARNICYYDSNKTFTREQATKYDEGTTIILQDGEKYIRICYGQVGTNASTDFSTYSFNLVELKYPKPVIDSNLQVNEKRPLISFIFDSDYKYNKEAMDLFDEFGYKACIALRIEGFINNDVAQYLNWQNNGHEISTHGTVNLGRNSTYDETQSIEWIKKAYEWHFKNGLNTKGYVALAGNFNQDYIKYLHKYFEWGSTLSNNSGSNLDRTLIDKAIDNPYSLWRWSLQTHELDMWKQAVDICESQEGLLLFYGHLQEQPEGRNLTIENLRIILEYIKEKDIAIVTPAKAIKEYFTLKPSEYINLLNS